MDKQSKTVHGVGLMKRNEQEVKQAIREWITKTEKYFKSFVEDENILKGMDGVFEKLEDDLEEI